MTTLPVPGICPYIFMLGHKEVFVLNFSFLQPIFVHYYLFGQFQTVHKNVGFVKSMGGEAEPSLPYILQTWHISGLELSK